MIPITIIGTLLGIIIGAIFGTLFGMILGLILGIVTGMILVILIDDPIENYEIIKNNQYYRFYGDNKYPTQKPIFFPHDKFFF